MKYYLVLKRTELLRHSHKKNKTWENMKCIWLSERSQPEMATCYMVPTKQQFGKGKTMGSANGCQEFGEREGWSSRAKRFLGQCIVIIKHKVSLYIYTSIYLYRYRYINSAVATGLETVSFHSNPNERQWQRRLKLLHNCTHLTR